MTAQRMTTTRDRIGHPVENVDHYRNGYWRDHAACTPENAELFDYPPGTLAKSMEVRQQLRRAFAICRACPVAMHCLLDALDNRDTGVRAGALFDDGKRVETDL